MPTFFSPDNQPRESDVFSYPQYELLRDTARDHADIFAMSLPVGFGRRCSMTLEARVRTSVPNCGNKEL